MKEKKEHCNRRQKPVDVRVTRIVKVTDYLTESER